MSRGVATNLNQKRRGAPGSGLPGLDVRAKFMEAIVQFIVALVTLVIEVTVHATVFIFHLVMAILLCASQLNEKKSQNNPTQGTPLSLPSRIQSVATSLNLAWRRGLVLWALGFGLTPDS